MTLDHFQKIVTVKLADLSIFGESIPYTCLISSLSISNTWRSPLFHIMTNVPLPPLCPTVQSREEVIVLNERLRKVSGLLDTSFCLARQALLDLHKKFDGVQEGGNVFTRYKLMKRMIKVSEAIMDWLTRKGSFCPLGKWDRRTMGLREHVSSGLGVARSYR